MKFYVDASERYPFWTLDAAPPSSGDCGRSEIELTDAEAADYQSAMEQFEKWQERIESDWEKREGS